MTDVSDVEAARRALADRLRAVGAVLLDEQPGRHADPAADAAQLLFALAESVVADPRSERIWLLLAGLCAAYPTRDEVDLTRRRIELADTDAAALYLLETGLARTQLTGAPLATVELVTDRVLVDVDFTARHDLHTGIQRVVRQTMPLWNLDHSITPVAWTAGRGALRELAALEAARVYEWSASDRSGGAHKPDRERIPDTRVLIPWHCVLVLPEVPSADVTPRIAAIGSYSENHVVAIGYDAIPLISADTLALVEPRKYMAYLSALKFVSRIAGISHASTREFAKFGSMLGSQGLPAPETVAVPLPIDFGFVAPRPDPSSVGVAPAEAPSVVVVGSHDVRKNHLAVLHAAELLWQDGLAFRLEFVGGGGSNQEFYRRVDILRERGRDLSVRVAVTDDELQRAMSSSRFTVFPSLHEGYGLPVAESFALGTPVITTGYGSTAEIAANGGAILVDPRDDGAITDAMRLLLTDDLTVARLRAEIRDRAERTWQHYADDLWNALVEPLLADDSRSGHDERRSAPAQAQHQAV